MPRVFRANSTVPVSTYKPKNVDMTRNKDATCTVCIPFNVDIEMGYRDRICSIDSLSLLAGSDTFNKFVRVFDEFKIQKYHCCIDLKKPQTANLQLAPRFMPLDWRSPGPNGYNALLTLVDAITPANNCDVDNAQFFPRLRALMTAAGLIDQQGNRTYTQQTVGYAYFSLEILYRLLNNEPVAIRPDGMYNDNGFDGQRKMFQDNNGNAAGVTMTLVQNALVINQMDINIPFYQMIGAAALRQVPKGFYSGISSDHERRLEEMVNLYQFNPFNAIQPVQMFALGDMEHLLTDEEVESIGNYIHDAYLPGAGVHLSLEVNGTSATEKSLYMPTTVVHDISTVDSFNQMGRFIPVGILQNKVRLEDGRALLANGGFFDEYVQTIMQHRAGVGAQIPISSYCSRYTIRVNGNGVDFTVQIPFFICPIRTDINGVTMFVPDGPYVEIAPNSKNGGVINWAQAGLLNYANFSQYVWERVAGGSLIYNLAVNNDAHTLKSSTHFSIQAYITCRFRNVRNLFENSNIYYPYVIADLDLSNADYNNGIVQASLLGHSKGLVKATLGIRNSTALGAMLLPPNADLNQPLEIIRMFDIGGVVGYLCHSMVGGNFHNSVFDCKSGNNVYHFANYVLFGIAIQMSPNDRQRIFKFNYLGIANVGDNIIGITGQQANNTVYHVIYVALNVRTIPAGMGVPQIGNLPDRNNNQGPFASQNWALTKMNMCVSRLRSYGIVDGASKNEIIELECGVDKLYTNRQCTRLLDGRRYYGVAQVESLGVRVARMGNPTSNMV